MLNDWVLWSVAFNTNYSLQVYFRPKWNFKWSKHYTASPTSYERQRPARNILLYFSRVNIVMNIFHATCILHCPPFHFSIFFSTSFCKCTLRTSTPEIPFHTLAAADTGFLFFKYERTCFRVVARNKMAVLLLKKVVIHPVSMCARVGKLLHKTLTLLRYLVDMYVLEDIEPLVSLKISHFMPLPGYNHAQSLALSSLFIYLHLSNLLIIIGGWKGVYKVKCTSDLL